MVLALLLFFLFFEHFRCWLALVTLGVDVRNSNIKKCRNSSCPEQANIGSVQRARRREEAQVPAVGVRCTNGSVTPLVFGTNGGMGNECQRFLKHLADKIAQKGTEPYHIVITWLRTQISFELLRSVHACVRGSRTPFRSKIE